MTRDIVRERYTNGCYAENNPSWDSADSPWKARKLLELLNRHSISPRSIVEIGCGAGHVLTTLCREIDNCSMTGFDIAPDLAQFWSQISNQNIEFVLGDYFESSIPCPDLVLVLDVLEHLADPYSFLTQLRRRSGSVIFHFPLDLSVVSVARETPLLFVRKKVGHVHYFTKGLALSLLEECGFDVLDVTYSGASFNAPQRSLRTRAASVFRYAAQIFGRDFSVRLLGGDTLFVLAHARSEV